MPGVSDIQITIAQQVPSSYQQHIYQQQPIAIGEKILSIDKTRAQEQETTIQSLKDGGDKTTKIEEKRQGRNITKKRKKKEEKGKEKEQRISDGIRGNIIDVTV